MLKFLFMKSFDYKFPKVAHIGHNVSHSKKRTKRKFKRNLHTVTVMIDGERHRYKVPTKVLRMLKKQGVTTHWKKGDDDSGDDDGQSS